MSFYKSLSPRLKLEFSIKMIGFKYSMDKDTWDEWCLKMNSAQTESEFLDVLRILPEINIHTTLVDDINTLIKT